MFQGERQLTQGGALTRFRVSAAKEERFAEFYTGEVFDERIRHARRAQDMSFCRRIFQHRYAGRGIDPLQAWPLDHIAASDADGVVSFSAFCPLPFHVQRWLAVDVIAPHGGEYAFRLGTCGGVRLWCSGTLAACFTPFTRNEMQFLDVSLPFCQGENRVLLHLDELFERDTLCALKMVYLGEPPLGVVWHEGEALPQRSVPPEPDAERLLTLMAQREYGPEADALLYGLLKRVSAREEGSVFSLLTLLRLWQAHRNACFPEPLWRRVKSAILGYRYWHDERGCDVMDFWDPGHAAAFHTAQHLAGQLFPEALFIASSRTGDRQRRLGEMRMKGGKA